MLVGNLSERKESTVASDVVRETGNCDTCC